MGTDRIKEYSGTCLCGSGTVAIDYCTPDHAWPVSNPEWYEISLNCKECLDKYVIHQKGLSFFYVDRAEVAKLEEFRRQSDALRDALMTSAKVESIIDQFIAKLDSFPSMAARHRFLCGASLEYNTLPTFRKHWVGSSRWASHNSTPHCLQKFMNALRISDPEIDAEISRIDALFDASRAKPPHVGEAFYTATS